MKEYLYEVVLTKLAERDTNSRLRFDDAYLAAHYTNAKSPKRTAKRFGAIGSKILGTAGAITGGADAFSTARKRGHGTLRSAGHGLLGAAVGGGVGAAMGGTYGAITGTVASLEGKVMRKLHQKGNPKSSAFIDRLVSEGKAPNVRTPSRLAFQWLYNKKERERGMKAHGYKAK